MFNCIYLDVNEPADFVFMQLPDTLSSMVVQGGKLVKTEPVVGEEAMEVCYWF